MPVVGFRLQLTDIAGCLVLAFSLPLTSVRWGAAVIAGAAVYGLRSRSDSRRSLRADEQLPRE